MACDLILASSSPRRCELLRQVGLQFRICSPDVDESILPEETPQAYVARLAQQKAEAILQQHPNAVIIAADTTLDLDGTVITKPRDQADAFAIWRQLSGRAHRVLTGVCVLNQQQKLFDVVATEVHFQALSDAQMQAYWQTGEPQDKAGAYAIQGRAAQFITHIVGSYSNVVGLPLYETLHMLNVLCPNDSDVIENPHV